MATQAISVEEIRYRVAELGDWFHNMNLGGVETAPHHFLGNYPQCKWKHFQFAIPEDLTGKTVLDIGCNAGFYSIEMKRRGARRVLGIDSDERYLKQAEFAATVSGVDVELRQMNVYQVAELREKFDVVLFMGVLYHLRYPLYALDLLHEHAVGDTLIFQSLLRGSNQTVSLRVDYPFNETQIFAEEGYPVMHFVEHCYANDPTNWWIPNRSCVEAMLRAAGFEVTSRPEEEVYVCRRGIKRG